MKLRSLPLVGRAATRVPVGFPVPERWPFVKGGGAQREARVLWRLLVVRDSSTVPFREEEAEGPRGLPAYSLPPPALQEPRCWPERTGADGHGRAEPGL